VREHKYAGCSINLEIGPIEWPDMMTMQAIWNTTQKKQGDLYPWRRTDVRPVARAPRTIARAAEEERVVLRLS
jgi:hypothetical protein